MATRKRKLGEGSSAFQSLQDQLAQTQKKLEEQAERNAQREADLLRMAAENQNRFQQFSVMEKFLRQNPSFVEFLSQQAAQGIESAPSS